MAWVHERKSGRVLSLQNIGQEPLQLFTEWQNIHTHFSRSNKDIQFELAGPIKFKSSGDQF